MSSFTRGLSGLLTAGNAFDCIETGVGCGCNEATCVCTEVGVGCGCNKAAWLAWPCNVELRALESKTARTPPPSTGSAAVPPPSNASIVPLQTAGPNMILMAKSSANKELGAQRKYAPQAPPFDVRRPPPAMAGGG
eukprot:CAMPEP_0172942188 /NCGR_PEP_ID=MMETSP1075-20121228/224921_1 /TAXON_ID=2916 /ORGANISM="Ceratium fusus, Strain PA161109" /LENGTH=135 /DNA_ID=CAMNT_0013803609 /DNA_START=1134 /DNA_END=1537 /DNA_ORIENTATION=+